jgi:hypothetical protein
MRSIMVIFFFVVVAEPRLCLLAIILFIAVRWIKNRRRCRASYCAGPRPAPNGIMPMSPARYHHAVGFGPE